jgi:hypothetical protein
MAALFQDLANQSSFVFEGAVRQVGAVTTSGVQAAPDMAVVQITKVLKGPSVLSNFSGKEITVQLQKHETVHQGLQAVFFTNGLHFGEGVAVREVGRLDVREPDLERRVNDAARQASDDELYHRLNQAEIVVSGVAIDTFPYEPHTGEKPPVSEHDPEWWACLIEVKTVEKGEAAAREIVTLFAHSIDIVWYHSPKFEKGATGIWLMHSKDFRGNPVPGLVTDHPLDFQPISQLDNIRALIRRAQQ